MLPLFCVSTGISHRVQLAMLVFFSKAVLNATRSIIEKISDKVTLGTFCHRDQSFINRRGIGYCFQGRIVTQPDPPTRKNSDPFPLLTKNFKTAAPPPPPSSQTTLTYDSPILLSGPAKY